VIEAYSIAALALSTLYGVDASREVFAGKTYRVAGEPPTAVIYVDQLSAFLSLVFISVGLLSSIFSVGYLEGRKQEFHPLLLAMVTGWLGCLRRRPVHLLSSSGR
jgi:formate hydrogenlyase subunit 3/multisubunit Na+/H+ antiporter MnhD subunit